MKHSGRRGGFFELAEVAVFDLLHEGFALENVAVEIGGELAGHDKKLIVRDFGERDGAARGNKMRAPLKHQAGVPQSEDSEKKASGGEGGAAGAKEFCGAFKENGEAENEKRSERNEKAVAVRRNAGPIGITRNEKIKGEKGGEKWSAGARFAPPKKKEADDCEKKNGGPGEKSVIGREEHGEKYGRAPQPVLERDVAGLECAAVNEIAGDESGKQ